MITIADRDLFGMNSRILALVGILCCIVGILCCTAFLVGVLQVLVIDQQLNYVPQSKG